MLPQWRTFIVELNSCDRPEEAQAVTHQSGGRAVSVPACALTVGYDAEAYDGDGVVTVTPNALRLWEKVQLSPIGGPRPVVYHIVCPDSPKLLWAAQKFLKEAGCLYSACGLGSHNPDGDLSLPQDDSKGCIWTVPVQNREEDAAMSSEVECSIRSYSQTLKELGVLLETRRAGARHDRNAEAARTVVFVVDVFTGDRGRQAKLLNAMALAGDGWCGDARARPCCQRVRGSSLLTLPNSEFLREFAFSVYTKASSKHTIRRGNGGHAQGNGAAGEVGGSPPTPLTPATPFEAGGENATDASPPTATDDEPPLAWCVEAARVGTLFTVGSPIEAFRPEDGVRSLHVAFQYSPAQQVLAGVWLDHTGAAVRTMLIGGGLRSALRALWEAGRAWVSAAGPSCHIVVAFVGPPQESAIQEWTAILQQAVKSEKICASGAFISVGQGPVALSMAPKMQVEYHGRVILLSEWINAQSERENSGGLASVCVVEEAAGPGTAWPTGYRITLWIQFTRDPEPSDREAQLTQWGQALVEVAFQFSKLSWLTMSPIYPERASTLPLHCLTMERAAAFIDQYASVTELDE